MGRVEFDRETTPSFDKYGLKIDAYLDPLDELPREYDLREYPIFWLRHG